MCRSIVHTPPLLLDGDADAAESNGIDLPSTCRGGICGACVARVAKGSTDQSDIGDITFTVSEVCPFGLAPVCLHSVLTMCLCVCKCGTALAKHAFQVAVKLCRHGLHNAPVCSHCVLTLAQCVLSWRCMHEECDVHSCE